MPEQEVRIESEGPLKTSRELDLFAVIDEGKTPDLLKQLKATHPQYDANIRFWRTMGDVAFNRIQSNSDKACYLTQGRSEQDSLYNQRVSVSSFIPETPSLLSDFVGAVFSKVAKREFLKDREVDGKTVTINEDPQGQIAERLLSFQDEGADGNQTLNDSMRDALEKALVYGSVDLFLDHPSVEDDEEGTTVPGIAIFTPEDRLDWEVDDDGIYSWVKYRQVHFMRDSFNSQRIKVTEYRIVTSESVQVFRVVERKGKPKIIEQATVEHEFKSIPIRTLYWKQVEPGIGEPWVKALATADLKTFGLESDLRFDIFTHAHPTLLAWLHKNGLDDKPLTELNFGGAWGIHLNPGGDDQNMENVQYLALDISELQIQVDEVKASRELTRRLSSNGSDVQSDGAKPESGIALSIRQAQRSKNLLQAAKNLQEVDWQVEELVANEGEETEIDLGGILEVQYPDKFDQRSKDELDMDLRSAMQIGSRTLIKEIQKTIAAQIVGDGITADKLSQILKEIEAQDVTPAAPEAKEKQPEGDEGE